MNPSARETPGISLPPPSTFPEKGAALPQAPAAGGVGAAQPVAAAAETNQADDVSTTQSAMSTVVDDSELIEKEWVNRAKQIIAQTHGDPHRQSEQLTLMKAEYMKQRYNKVIKVDK